MLELLNRLSIGRKIVGLSLSLLFVMLAVSVYSFAKMHVVNKEADDLTSIFVPLSGIVARLDAHALEQVVLMERAMRLLAIGERDEKRASADLEEFEKVGRKVDQEIASAIEFLNLGLLRARQIDAAVGIARLEPRIRDLAPQHEQLKTIALQLIEAHKSGQKHEARVLEAQFQKAENDLDAALQLILGGIQSLTDRQSGKLHDHEREAYLVSIENLLSALIAFVLGAWLSLVITRRLVRPVQVLTEGAEQVRKGNLDVDIEVRSKDELGLLAQAFNQMVADLRTKERIKATFGKYMDPRIVERVLGEGTADIKTGERRIMTVFFSDMEGFSSISESLTPGGLVNVINTYLTLATEPITRHHGVIDKYIGDAVMAFWGPPFTSETEHARFACRAALEQFDQLAELQRILPEIMGIRKGVPRVNIRIGLCTGPLIVGSIGSNIMKSYTVMGDTVNLASRLEAANKQYGTRILITQDTQALVKSEFETREIDNIIVVGKDEPVRVFELLCESGQLEPGVAQLREKFENALSEYRNQNWDRSEALLLQCLEINPEDGPSRVFRERIKLIREHSLPSRWDGVWRLSHK